MKKRILSMILIIVMVLSLMPSLMPVVNAEKPSVWDSVALEPMMSLGFNANGNELKQNGSPERAEICYLIEKNNVNGNQKALWEAGKATGNWETEVWTGATGVSWSWYTTFSYYLVDNVIYREFSNVTPEATVSINYHNNAMIKFYENKGSWQYHVISRVLPYNASSFGGYIEQPESYKQESGNRDYGYRNQNAVLKYKNMGTNTYLSISYGSDNAYPLVKPTATQIISGQTLNASSLTGGTATAKGAYDNYGTNASAISGTYGWYNANTQMLKSGPARINFDSLFTNFPTYLYFENTTQTVDVNVRAANITLNPTSGLGGSASASGWFGENPADITPPTRAGYKFTGYYTATTGGTQYFNSAGKASKNWDIASDLTLYAQWERQGYTVTINVKKNDEMWSGHGKTFKLISQGTEYTNLTDISDGTYDVYDTASGDTNIDVIVNGANTSATVDYYMVNITAGIGIQTVSASALCVKGTNLPMAATVKSGYTWSKWINNSDGMVFNTNSSVMLNVNKACDITSLATFNEPTISVANGYSGAYDINSHNINVTANHSASNVILSYQWYKGSVSVDNKIGTNSNLFSVKNLVDSGIYYCVVTATADGQNSSKTSSAITVSVSKATPTITVPGTLSKSFDTANLIFNLGGTTNNTESPALSYSSSDESVATVDASGNVTIKKIGNATITTSSLATTSYNAQSATTALTVTKGMPFITFAANPVSTQIFGNIVTFTAGVSGVSGTIPTGTVTFTGTNLFPQQTVNLVNGIATYTTSSMESGDVNITATFNGDASYNSKAIILSNYRIKQYPVTLTVENKEHFYESGKEQKISITNTGSILTESDFTVKYYYVSENEGSITSTTPVSRAISTGKYLYVIDFKDASYTNYAITRKFSVLGTALPNVEDYDNIGYMDIRAAQSGQQKPIYFASGVINKFVIDSKFINPLTNLNSGTVEYTSSNISVATIDTNGEVTIAGEGTTTIMATSKMQNTADVFASYTLIVAKKAVTVTAVNDTIEFGTAWDKSTTVIYSDGLSASDFSGTLDFDANYNAGSKVGEYKITPKGLNSDKYAITFVPAILTVTPKQLIANDFIVTPSNKIYDGNVSANLTASVKDVSIFTGNTVKVEIVGSFTDSNAQDNKSVNYTITALTGKDADNYAIAGGSITGTAFANITKAIVSIICASNTTRIYDGNVQNADISAMANGEVFDSNKYTVKYIKNGESTAIISPYDVGIYTVSVELNDAFKTNYEVASFTATLTIKEATQEVFSIENVPDRVYYGDTFTVNTQEAQGSVTYGLNNDAPATIGADGTVIVTGVGKVTITATSTKNGYTNKIANRTFTVYPRVVTPTAIALGRVYNGNASVDVNVSVDNVFGTDAITATGTGIMSNSDAGANKQVYVSAIALTGDKSSFYALSTTNLQTTVDIEQASITGFDVSAQNKTYDGNINANATVNSITGVIVGDVGQIHIIGSANYDNAVAGIGKTVTYTATELTGSKSANYKFANGTSDTASTIAEITPMNVAFSLGATTFKYDGDVKEVSVSANDELGRIFTYYNIEYWKDSTKLNGLPSEAGDYTIKIVLNDNTNYATTQPDVTMTIAQTNQEQITIVGLPGTIEYTDIFDLEAIGGSGSGTFSWYSDDTTVTVTPNVLNPSKATVTVNGAVGSKVTITAIKAADENFTQKEIKTVFVPTEKIITFILGDLTQVYTGNEKEASVTPSVVGANYTVSYNGASTIPTQVGTYNMVVTAYGNYKGSSTGTLTVEKAIMSGLIVNQEGCTYGDTLPNATYSNAPSGVNVAIHYSTYDGQKPTQAGNYTVTATYIGANYETFTTSTIFTIVKKVLTVKADNASRQYGEANPVFTLNYNGYIQGESNDSLLSEPIAICNANASSNVGEYTITVSGGRSDNYSFNYDDNGKLSITGANGGNLYITGANNSVSVGDIFTLRAYYGNQQPEVSWESSDATVAYIDSIGKVTVLKQGETTITARITDANYAAGIYATFKLNASKKLIQLKPSDLVKVYNAQRQDVTLTSNTAFVPVISGENKNMDVEYTLTTDGAIKEPKQVGVYTVTYTINNPSYTGSGTVTMYINKATVTVLAKDLTKIYGEGNPKYLITGLIGNDEISAEYIAKITNIFNITSDADQTAAKTAVGVYDVSLALKEGLTLNDDTNYNILISSTKGKLAVTPAPLNIKVSDATRIYGDENINPQYEYVGFVNGETESNLIAKPIFTYADGITKASNVNTYADVITASAAMNNNYTITYSYTDGSGANLTITKLPVTVTAGTARSSHLTVNLSKAIEGLTETNFAVTLNGQPVTISGVTADSSNTTYKLLGTFSTSEIYQVVVIANGANYELSGNPLSIKPIKPSSNSGSGNSGGGSIGGTVTIPNNVNVTQSEGGKISVEGKTYKITPDEGYEIKDVLVNGKSVGADSEYIIDKVTANTTITAEFKKIVKVEPTPEPTEWKNPFSDVNENDWYFNAIKFANENKLMGGTETASFEPNSDVTRAMFVTVLYRMENEPNATTSIFNDVENGAYYEKAIAWASNNSIVLGVEETEFAPNNSITREQMVAIICRYAKYKGVNITAEQTSYVDNARISGYAKDAVDFCTQKGIITGKGNNAFAPNDNATRAETAAVLQRIKF